MKTKMMFLFFVLILIPVVILGTVFAVDTDDPDVLLATIDNDLFRRTRYFQDYTEIQGYINEFLENDVIHQYYVNFGRATDMLISMTPNKETIRKFNIRTNPAEYHQAEFHVTYTMMRTETIPAKTGGRCWMRYGNMYMKRDGTETCVTLIPGDNAYLVTIVDGSQQYEPIADLSFLSQDDMITFDFIRLGGETFFYADSKFLFKYKDGFNSQVSFQGGSELFEGSNLIRCEFDNFRMTVQ